MSADPLDLDAIEAKNRAAQQMVFDLCKREGEPGRRRWEMSIPARADHDPDLIIMAGLWGMDALVARVRELEAAIQTARADYEKVEQACRDLHRVVHLQAVEITESANECCELRATLANERGEGEAPSEGWYWADGQWNREDEGAGLTTVERNPCPVREDADAATCPWLPTTWTIRTEATNDDRVIVVVGTHDLARDAMRAADKARGAT